MSADLVILGELNQLPSEEVIPHCVKKLRDAGEERQLQFIQRNLLEVAYCKLGELFTSLIVRKLFFANVTNEDADQHVHLLQSEQHL